MRIAAGRSVAALSPNVKANRPRMLSSTWTKR
jgi:hypothetical protein